MRCFDYLLCCTQTIAEYMPLGVAVKLVGGETGFFLGEVRWGKDNDYSGLGVATR